MAERKKSFLLRLDRPTFEAVQRWADDDLRSVNGQIEFLLRRALGEAGRRPGRGRADDAGPAGAGPDRGAAAGSLEEGDD
jgi:hypothetical protein